MVKTEDIHQWTRKEDKMMALVFETFGHHSSFTLLTTAFAYAHLPSSPVGGMTLIFLVGRGSSS